MPTLGPENPTLTERMIGSIHLPYVWGALLFAALFGPIGQFFFAYLDTWSLQYATTLTFTISYQIPPTAVPIEQGILSQGLWSLYIFATIYLTRFMRLKLVDSESELISIASEGEETIHRSFRLASKTGPQLAIAVPLLLLGIPYALSLNTYLQANSMSSSVYALYLYKYPSILSFFFGSWIWIYASQLWGLHRFGKQPLRLRPYHEDSMLGLRPMGSIALTLFFSYFAVVGLGILSTIVFNPTLIGAFFVAVLTGLGIVMFFLPLNSIHQHLQRVKHLQQASIRKQFAELQTSADNPKPKTSGQLLARLTELQILQMRGEEASRIPTWPLDTAILTRFAAVIISVIAILLSRVIILVLGLG